ncbi:MAG: helix-hairpin-helix domain-containing protein [Acidobacteriia bacterium]|nr:helix-hairpin-helix domain-containing protein [Terriglobia bacterium]
MRRTAPESVIDNLSRIPGVGPSIASDLYLLGIHDVAELRGRNAESLYLDLCERTGLRLDRCVLYVFRCAVYFASETNPDPEKLNWWTWKESPVARPGPRAIKKGNSVLDPKGTPQPIGRTRGRP